MTKCLILMGLFWCMPLFAQPQALQEPTKAFKQALGHFNPGDFVSGFTLTPPQAALNPGEEQDHLKAQGLEAMRHNEVASELYTNEKTRTKVFENPDSDYLQVAQQLIDSGDSVREGGCIAQPPRCTTNSITQTCDETVHYEAHSCFEALQVSVTKRTHSIRRFLDRRAPFDLAHCAGRIGCTPADEVHVSSNCHSVGVETRYQGVVIDTNHDQTCKNLMLNIALKSHPNPGHAVVFELTVTETIIEDFWDKKACIDLAEKGSACVFEQGEACIDAQVTKSINGVPITRACWGGRYQYQCVTHTDNQCLPWINQGCTQIKSACVKKDFGVCVQYSQTFECAHTRCTPEPDMCMPALPCMDGSCDTTKNEESQDMGEGASRLGALAGGASEVSKNQIDSGIAAIFAGSSMQCETFPLGFRDCCKDSGWGDWVLHCPKELQELQKAKAEERVVFVGEYADWLLDSVTHYVYCIFPTKLSSIVQIQGRGAQLHIPFGTPEIPNCRGMTSEELERIAFDKLNVSSLEKEFMARLSPPDLGGVTSMNQAHIERLNQLGKPYD